MMQRLTSPPLRKWFWPALSSLVFMLTGLALIPYPGLHHDELFFAGPIYSPDDAFFSVRLGAMKIPFMVMSYSGALKTWVYEALFQFVPPNVWSVRLPALLAGAVTIWLTWAWVRRIAGARAAAIAAVLLSTDTIFLITDTFDWGPVALQHVLLMGGLLAVQVSIENQAKPENGAKPKNRAKPMLALGFFLWGLGMWDKALLAWPLIGLGLASFCVFPKETFHRVRFATVVLALVSFGAGALPLVWFNVAKPGATAKANAGFHAEGFRNRAVVLRQTIEGNILIGYMARGGKVPGTRPPATAVERCSVAIQRLVGPHYTNWMLPAWVLGFAFSAALWHSPARRALLFLAIAVLAGWLQMALNKGTGGSSHHTILLWPFPAVFLGIAFSAMAERIPRYGPAALTVLVAFLAVENLLTTNEYLADFATKGPAGVWTDAIFPLSDSLSPRSARWFGIVDWGCLNGLRVLHEGELPLFIPDPDGDRGQFLQQIASPDFLFIQHTRNYEVFPGVNDRLRMAARSLGYVERIERTVADRNGRPVFELFRFEKAGAL